MLFPDLTPSPFERKKQKIISEVSEIADLTISTPTIKFNISDDLRYLAENPDWQNKKPDACGQLYLRETICPKNPESIFITCGTSESYSALFKIFCKKGDSILTPNPGYPLINAIAELEGLKTEPYFLKPAQAKWKIDFENLTCSPRAKIFLLIAPHNPTGHIPSQEEYEKIITFCEKNKLALVIDEVFSAYIFEGNSQLSRPQDSKIPIFHLNGLSKSMGLPHIKVGWLKAQSHFEELEYVLDASLNCSYLSQALVARILPKAKEYQQRVMEHITLNRKMICEHFDCIPAQGGWYQSIHFKNADDERLCLGLLKNEKILAHPGFLFDFEEDGWLVVSLLPELELIERFCKNCR